MELSHLEKNDATWNVSIYNLPGGAVKFLLNSAVETLDTLQVYLRRNHGFHLFLNFSKIESSLIQLIIDILGTTSELELDRVKDNAN